MALWIVLIAVGGLVLLALYAAAVVAFLAEMSSRIIGEDTPWHTAESVSRELAEGLDDGSIVLSREDREEVSR